MCKEQDNCKFCNLGRLNIKQSERNPTLYSVITRKYKHYHQCKIRTSEDNRGNFVKLIIVKKRHHSHSRKTDYDKYKLSHKKIVAIALCIIGKSIACREHHNCSDCKQNKNYDAEWQIYSHSDCKPLCFLHFALTGGTDEKLFLLDFLLRIIFVIVNSVYVCFKHHSFVWSHTVFPSFY